MPLYRLPFYGFFYRGIMKLAHRFDWHYLRPMPVIEKGRLDVRCDWCGARHTFNTEPGPLKVR